MLVDLINFSNYTLQIGSNDLTQLTLGVDRDSVSLIAYCQLNTIHESQDMLTVFVYCLARRDCWQTCKLYIDCTLSINTTIATYADFFVYCLFDEENSAVKTATTQAIKGAHRNGKEVGLCGQAPSDKPDFAGFLVHLGIDSISLTPDSVLQAIDIVSNAEMKDSIEKEIGEAIILDKTMGEVKVEGANGAKKIGM
jgi:phosphoenolpyruvate synthase/pyruvate phosphate dikinase